MYTAVAISPSQYGGASQSCRVEGCKSLNRPLEGFHSTSMPILLKGIPQQGGKNSSFTSRDMLRLAVLQKTGAATMFPWLAQI